jgi:hypothetical protein
VPVRLRPGGRPRREGPRATTPAADAAREMKTDMMAS